MCSVSAFAMVVSHRHAIPSHCCKTESTRNSNDALCRPPCSAANHSMKLLLERQQKLHPPRYIHNHSKQEGMNIRATARCCVNVLTMLRTTSISFSNCIEELHKLNARRIRFHCVCVCLNGKWMGFVNTRNFGCNAGTRVVHFEPLNVQSFHWYLPMSLATRL